MSGLFPQLFSPMRVGRHLLPNRLAQGALSSVMHERNAVSQRHIDFYATRAAGGASLLVTESLAAHSTLPPGTRVRAVDEANFDGLKAWADAVNAHGGRLVGQFVDPGRGRHHPGRSMLAIGASARPDDLSWTMPRVLDRADIARIVGDFGQTAARLQRAGFSGVELSCGHGHLLHQFLSPQANRRADDYGGSVENRTRLIREIVAAIRAECTGDFIVGLKVPGDDGVPGGVSGTVAEETVDAFASRGLADYFTIAQGAHHPLSFDWHLPDYSFGHLPYAEITRRLRAKAHGIPVFAIGGVVTPADAQALIADGCADGVMLARPMLADPHWVKKASEGRQDEIQRCIGCNGCWEEIIEGRRVACVVNTQVAEPDEVAAPAIAGEVRRRVVVVGAGPAGLSAAKAAAAAGNETILLSHSDRAGGALALQAELPGCERLGHYIEDRLRLLRAHGVMLRTGSEATVDAVLAERPDRVILATGATMMVPDELAGQALPDLRAAIGELLATARRGRVVVLYDCDHTIGTYDAAGLLASRFERLVIVTPRPSLAQDTNLASRLRVLRMLNHAGAEIVPFSELVGVEGTAATLRNIYTGAERRIEAVDCATYSAPRIPRDALGVALDGRVEIVRVGDGDRPGTLMRATRTGAAAGRMAWPA